MKGILAFIMKDKAPQVVENIRVLFEFSRCVSRGILGLPPVRKIDFTVELVLGTTLISKAPYHLVGRVKRTKSTIVRSFRKGFI